MCEKAPAKGEMAHLEEGNLVLYDKLKARTGPELRRATRPYVEEDRAKTWCLLLMTLAALASCYTAIVFLPWWPAKLATSVLAGLVAIRLFIFFHDYLHGAILMKSKPGKVIMSATGMLMLSVTTVWRETHNFHHKHNSKIVGSSVGSFPILTTDLYRALTDAQKRVYRLTRHPLTIILGYVPIFMYGMCIAPFVRNPRRHWSAPVALLVHWGALAALLTVVDVVTAVSIVVIPVALATGLGSYLFYAQHNFPDMKLRCRTDWDYNFAALESSSMFDMGATLNWFTGNIGYHHVHHLNHRIPFYRLREAMEAIPELQRPGHTSWHPRDIKGCLRLDLWSVKDDRMVTFTEAGF